MPGSGGGEGRTDREPSRGGSSGTVGTVEHHLCGVACFLATTAIAVLFYPALLIVTQRLHVLSSTALILVLTTIWVVTWVGLELAWEWRAGRTAAKA